MQLKACMALLAVAAFALAGAARAELTGIRLTFSPFVGVALWDRDVGMEDRTLYGGRAGLAYGNWLGVEGNFGVSRTQTTATPGVDTRAYPFGIDLVVNLWRPAAIVPYLLGGVSRLEFDPDNGANRSYNGFDLGGGANVRLTPRLHFRLDARDVLFKPDTPSRTHNFLFTMGLQLALGGSAKDTDRDGVGDHADLCPETALGAVVDAQGCPKDSDGDGVYDGLDTCAATPAGATVDAQGCPLDTDADGVYDGIDQCAETPLGAQVDTQGCPTDSDGDGVYDGIDTCPGTPAGARVDTFGCPIDSDGDGVYDGLDQCDNTPPNLRVDIQGCPIEVSDKEVQLLETGMIRLDNVHFETGRWDIRPESYAVLDEVGRILVEWSQLQIEIGGHTDSQGGDAYNMELSRQRAQAVQDYLLRKFPRLGASQYSVRGYGESMPIADNATAAGRQRNRRVEFKVLNTSTLRKEVERRRMLERKND